MSLSPNGVSSQSQDPGAGAGPQPNVQEAGRFLELLGPGEEFTFQTFPDKPDQQSDAALRRVLHGSFADLADQLRDLNDQGAGVFVMVNRGDGFVHEGSKTCRTAKNVVAVRANFVDLDGAPLEPVLEARAEPSIVVESSPGRWHVYWLVRDEPVEDFTAVQATLASRFNGDPQVKDLPRVLRLPGFLHRKAAPHLVRVLRPSGSAQARLYAYTELSRILCLQGAATYQGADVRKRPALVEKFGLPGSRNVTLTRVAGALRRFGFTEEAMQPVLARANEVFAEPLNEGEVARIAGSISAYPSADPAALKASLSDTGNAERFVRQWYRDVRFVPEWVRGSSGTERDG